MKNTCVSSFLFHCLLSLMDVYVKRQSFTSSLHHQNWNPNRKNKWDSQGSEKSQLPQLVCRIPRNNKCSLILETKGSCWDFLRFSHRCCSLNCASVGLKVGEAGLVTGRLPVCAGLNGAALTWTFSVTFNPSGGAATRCECERLMTSASLSHQLIIFTSFKQEVLMAVNGATLLKCTWIKV